MQTVSLHHALSCSNGGDFIAFYNYICDKIINLSRQAVSPICIGGKPLIHQGHSRSEGGVSNGVSIPETQGDVLIRGM